MLISDSYREQNRLLHETNDLYGRSGARWAGLINKWVNDELHGSVLDYGCGKSELANGLTKLGCTAIVTEYDPAIPGKDATPEPADLVVCTDVCEHLEPGLLNSVLRDIQRVTKRKVLFHISTRPAIKTLPDGRNAHICLHDADWWREKLRRWFQITAFDAKGGALLCEAFPIVEPSKIIRVGWHAKNNKRRPFPKAFAPMMDHVKSESAKYNDAFNRINEIRMWEGGLDEQHSDMQFALNILGQMEDIDLAIKDICSLSSKGIMVHLMLTENRTEKMWRTVFERHIRISDWYVERNGLVVIGSPAVQVQGVTAFGVVDSEERWQQVKAAAARFPGRFEPSPAHDRRAIIACYGPSLAATIQTLKNEAQDPIADVFCVSGAHDYLIENGIVPDGHIECDPRPHKAKHVTAHPDVTYLIASCVHHDLFDKLPPDNVKLWHAANAEHSRRVVDELGEPATTLVSGGGSVGLRSIPLLYAMGYRDFYIFAMDCSFTEDGARQHAGKHAGKRQDLSEVKCGDRIFISSPQLMTYATGFFEQMKKVSDVNYRLYGDGLLPAMAAYFNQFEEAA